MARSVGFEPTTLHLKGGCSNQLSYERNWRREPELNRRGRICNPVHEPFCHRVMAPKDGIEPPPRRPSTDRSTAELLWQGWEQVRDPNPWPDGYEPPDLTADLTCIERWCRREDSNP